MEYIHRRSAGVIWLNPLAGSTDYQSSVQGMEAAMPYIDVFAPVHNVDSLRILTRHLRTFRRKGKLINPIVYSPQAIVYSPQRLVSYCS